MALCTIQRVGPRELAWTLSQESITRIQNCVLMAVGHVNYYYATREP